MMGTAAPPVVKLTVEHLQHSILHYLGDYQGQMEEAIKMAVREYVDGGGFMRDLRDRIAQGLKSQIGFIAHDATVRALDTSGWIRKEIEIKVKDAIRYLEAEERAKGGA